MAISPQKPLSTTEAASLNHAAFIAANAHDDLSSKAGDGAKARPTVAQLNRTLERLVDIQSIIERVLAAHEAPAVPAIVVDTALALGNGDCR